MFWTNPRTTKGKGIRFWEFRLRIRDLENICQFLTSVYVYTYGESIVIMLAYVLINISPLEFIFINTLNTIDSLNILLFPQILQDVINNSNTS